MFDTQEFEKLVRNENVTAKLVASEACIVVDHGMTTRLKTYVERYAAARDALDAYLRHNR